MKFEKVSEVFELQNTVWSAWCVLREFDAQKQLQKYILTVKNDNSKLEIDKTSPGVTFNCK